MNAMMRSINFLLVLGMLVWSHAAGAATQTLSPTTCTSVTGVGTVAWTNPANAVSNNGSYATASVDGTTTNYLVCTRFGFTIPAGATINGITVSVDRKSSSTADGGSQDAAVRLVKSGAIGTVDRSTGTIYPTADAYEAHGGGTDLWGTGWMPSDINSNAFGAAFAVTKPSAAGGAHTVSVDHIQVTVDYTPGTVINTYYPGTAANVAVGDTSIALGAASGAGTPIAAGDLLLIMQMQDASINGTNTDAYGDGVAGGAGSGATAVGKSGQYEYAVAANAVPIGGGTLNLACGTLNAYTNAAAVAGSSGQKKYQVIRVPVYASYTMGALTAQAWNGATGGVLAFDASGALNLNSATATVDGMGFRGGGTRYSTSGSGAYSDYRTPQTNLANGSKGEGIAGTPYYVFTPPGTLTNTGVDGYPNGSLARGAPANGGGGATDRNPAANDQNAGGGGGANGGAGGIGGIGWCPGFVNTAPYYGCGYAALFLAGVNPNGSSGGFGGAAVAGLGAGRLTLGGGGGSGTANNITGSGGCAAVNGLCASGVAGGGIIMVRAGSITGSGTFNANGASADSTVGNDGSGGGGAGGAVLINAASGLGGATINVNGGAGGSNLLPWSGSSASPHGPGGGGGGGYAITSAAPAGCNAAGGASGFTYNTGTYFGAYGAMPGSAGSCASTLTSAQIPGSGTGGFPACPNSIHHFAIGTGGASASTCTAKSIAITAQNIANGTITNYTGTVNITTSTNHGDWSKVAAGGTLTQAVADSGAASYQFVAGDNGVATLGLTNHHADGNLTITVVDSTQPLTSSTSAAINFSDNAFVITNDPIQVAGRPQAMSVAMWRKDPGTGVCAISPYYAGARNLKAWLTRDVDDPGGAAPTIGALSLPNALPGANNLALNFAAGSAGFNLGTADVGKYVLNLRDDSRTFASVNIDGSSSAITTRPFALVVSAIKQGAANNPAAGGPGGAVFAKAGSSFQATVGAYLWTAAADANNDGVPDVAATLAAIIGAGATPSYRWATTLAAGIPYTPATPLDVPAGTGVAGTFSNGTQSGACPTGSPNCFTNGVATPTNLSYSEVGSFTLGGTATNFLNSGIDLTALVFDNSATPARNGVVGRFIPDHFVMSGASLTNRADIGCAGSTFTYMAEPFNVGFTLTAQNAANGTTQNYATANGFAKLDGATVANWTQYAAADSVGLGAIDNGAIKTPLTGRLAAASPAGAWTAGGAAFSAQVTVSRAAAPDGPFESFVIGVAPQDADGVTLLAGAFNLDADNNATKERATVGSTKIRFGRLRLANAYGSELLDLPVAMTLQYWKGTYFVTHPDDTCTTFAPGDFTLGNYQKNLNAGETGVSIAGGLPANLKLTKPGAGNNGSVDVTVNLGAKLYLQGAWTGAAYNENPVARAMFGSYKRPIIYLRENF